MKLAAMMEAAIQRRFPKGLKVHVRSIDRFGCLSSLTRVLKDANLCVTRAKVCSPRICGRLLCGLLVIPQLAGSCPSVFFSLGQCFC